MAQTSKDCLKGVRELRVAFDSAKSLEEKLGIFNKIEAKLDEHQLGGDCWKMAYQLYKQKQDPLKIIHFGKRALNVMLHERTNDLLGCKRSSLCIASIVHVLGSASFDLKRYNESLSYFNWADRNLSQLLLDHFRENSVLQITKDVHLGLSKLKEVMGRGNEVVFHLNKVLEIKEKTMRKGCIEIGRACKDVSDAYYQIGNVTQALSFTLKALEIYEEHLANDSQELAMLRMQLGCIYLSLREFDKALEQNRLSLECLKSVGNTSLLLKGEAYRGHILVDLGCHDEAIEAFKSVISQPENAGNQQARALAFTGIATAFFRKGILSNARKYVKCAVRVLETKGLSPGAVATGLLEMAGLYEEMKEYEAAISLVQKALNLPDLLQEPFAKCSLRLFSLISLSGTEEDRLPILEEVVERLTEKFGPEHCHVGTANAKLGKVYIKLGRLEMAAESFLLAKDILNVSLGPHPKASLRASVDLSLTYAALERYDIAVENQEKVVECLKGLGPIHQAKLDAAVKVLNLLKDEATGDGAESHTRASLQAEDGEDMPTMILQNLLLQMNIER